MLDYSAFQASESHPIMFHNNHWDPFEPLSPGTSPSLCAPSLWCYCQLGLPHQSQLPSPAPCQPHCVWSVCQEPPVSLELEVQRNLRSVVLTSDYMCPIWDFLTSNSYLAGTFPATMCLCPTAYAVPAWILHSATLCLTVSSLWIRCFGPVLVQLWSEHLWHC